MPPITITTGSPFNKKQQVYFITETYFRHLFKGLQILYYTFQIQLAIINLVERFCIPEERRNRMAEEKQLHHFQCQICGYVYETEEEELPDGFVCPLCGASKDNFVKLD
jgi:rubredoxin